MSFYSKNVMVMAFLLVTLRAVRSAVYPSFDDSHLTTLIPDFLVTFLFNLGKLPNHVYSRYSAGHLLLLKKIMNVFLCLNFD